MGWSGSQVHTALLPIVSKSWNALKCRGFLSDSLSTSGFLLVSLGTSHKTGTPPNKEDPPGAVLLAPASPREPGDAEPLRGRRLHRGGLRGEHRADAGAGGAHPDPVVDLIGM